MSTWRLYCFSNVVTLFWDGFGRTGDTSRWSAVTPSGGFVSAPGNGHNPGAQFCVGENGPASGSAGDERTLL